MGRAPRTIVCAGTLMAAGCATLAGLEAPTEEPAETDAAFEQKADLPEASSSSSPETSDATDAPVDTGPVPDACTARQDGEMCKAAADCCSVQCRDDNRCVPKCEVLDGNCPFSVFDHDCCLGLWCTGGVAAKCRACIPKDQPAVEDGFGERTRRSCCSQSMRQDGICE